MTDSAPKPRKKAAPKKAPAKKAAAKKTAAPKAAQIAVIGAGPAGLMAAETMAAAGLAVTVFERMPSAGRKFLMAGRGGLNLTHSEPLDAFRERYGAAKSWMTLLLDAFSPSDLVAWAEGLGEETFVGSSGRVFPKVMKASPLLRAWLSRLAEMGVQFKMRSQWTGWDLAGGLAFADGSHFAAEATVLALGGASWPRLGSDGGWTKILSDVEIAPLRAANSGFIVTWSDIFREKHAGAPLKRIAMTVGNQRVRGEAMIGQQGIEGGAVYALSATARETIAKQGFATLYIDLLPDMKPDALAANLNQGRGGDSMSNILRKRAGLSPAGVGLVQEARHAGDARPLAEIIKGVPVKLTAPFDIARAISTAGGIALGELDGRLMLEKRPGVFACGEMLNWEAPTGGYLLQGCMATGAAAGRGVIDWLREQGVAP